MKNPDQTVKKEIMQGENQSLLESVFVWGKKGNFIVLFKGQKFSIFSDILTKGNVDMIKTWGF